MSATAPREPPLSPGDLVSGKYRIERLIAWGGMGVVMAARNEALEQRVAIKFLLDELASQKDGVDRFVREARASARLQSDHVVRVFDVAKTDDGLPYMVMEYLEGIDLADVLDARGALPIAEAVDYVLQLLLALSEAHSAGIVHRDLKPSNVFIAGRPDGTTRVKVLDFGISKVTRATEPTDRRITTTSITMGTPSYMSPEQIVSARDVDGRSDLWSVGVILYELLSGAPAFAGETFGATFAAIREQDLPPVSTKRPDVPEGLDRVLSRALRRSRDERFGSARELAEALAPFGTGTVATASTHGETAAEHAAAPRTAAHPSLGRAIIPEAVPSDGGGVSATGTTWSTARRGARSTTRIVAAFAGVIAIGALGWLTIVRPASEPPVGQLTGPASASSASANPPASAAPAPTEAPVVAPLASSSATAAPSAPPSALPPPRAFPRRSPRDLLRTRD